ncbi:DUF4003 family protein [Clostridium baratii]|uniref:DUF4003 family protein n=1 Tax=Clostridium baratii TaxID=1561 RepID=UPI003D354DFE
MDKLLYGITNKVIESYRLAKNKLRFDGEYINHFTSLVFRENENINIDKIKEIRKYIKANTSKMSSFRGDILYMLSILISKQEDYLKFSDRLIYAGEILKDNDFKEGAYLALSSYALAKYGVYENYNKIVSYIKDIYKTLKKEYKNFVGEDDYLVCTLLAIEASEKMSNVNEMGAYIQSVFNYFSDLEDYSKNDLQGIASSILLNKNVMAPYKAKNIIKIFDRNDLKIADEVLPLIGVVSRGDDAFKYVKKVKDVIECLCEEEAEYTFYMDKTFRTLIGIFIVEIYEKEKGAFSNKYLEELLCFVIYSFIVSKNQGLFEEVLA